VCHSDIKKELQAYFHKQDLKILEKPTESQSLYVQMTM